ncbi:MAG: hypothetical protein ACQGVC_15625 [Myxococcota bacterium]
MADRNATLPLGSLALLLLVFALTMSALAPVGRWQNRVFGTPAWGEADPGTWYVFVAHDLGSDEPPRYHGHPGTPLLLLLNAVQRAHHAVAAPAGEAFDRFTARHLDRVLWLSKALVSAAHLLSFWALFALSRRVLGDARGACLATLGYATSLPVLYYLSRVSPEPLMVAFWAASLLALFACRSRVDAGALAPAAGFAALAGLASVSAALAKLQLAGPLPAWIALFLLLHGPPRARVATLGAFGAAALGVFVLYSQWIDWPLFLDYWRRLARPLDANLAALAPGGLLPGLSTTGLFPLAEGLFLGLAAVGAVRARAFVGEQRVRALAVGGCAVFGLAVFAYRVLLAGDYRPFHYAFLLLAAGAPFFGLAVADLERRLPGAPRAARAWIAPALVVLGLHGLSLAAVVDARRHDAAVFAPNRPAWTWIARLAPGERLVLHDPQRPHQAIGPRGVEARLQNLSGWPAGGLVGIGGPPPTLARAFASLFVGAPPGFRAPGAERIPVPALGLDLVRLPRSDGD